MNKHFAGKKPAVGQAIAYILGGVPASGKSSIVRLPPENIVIACHKGVSEILPQAIRQGLFDELELWDTETGVKKVATVRNGQMQVLDQTLWGKFLAKGVS